MTLSYFMTIGAISESSLDCVVKLCFICRSLIVCREPKKKFGELFDFYYLVLFTEGFLVVKKVTLGKQE